MILLGIFICNTILNVLIMMLTAQILNVDGVDFGMILPEILIPSSITIVVSLIVFVVINQFKTLKMITSIYLYNITYLFALLNMGVNISAGGKFSKNNDLHLIISLVVSFLIILSAAYFIKKNLNKQL